MMALAAWALAVAGAGADPCAVPAAERAPDPRCGEALDGRVPAEPSTARQVGRATLAVPRLATKVLFWPIVKTTDFLEYHRVVDWTRAILTTDDGLVGVRPELHYSTSFRPTAGARFFYRRLPGPGSEIMTRFRTAGPATILAEVGLAGPDWLGLSLLASWNRRNDRLFAGIGPQSNADLEAAGRGHARYASDNLGAELRWSRRLPWRLVVAAHADVQRRDYRADGVNGGPSVAALFGLPADVCGAQGLPAGCVDQTQLPRFHSGLRIGHIGGGLGLDLRNPARDGSGFGLSVDGTLAQGLAGDPTRHATVAAETVVAIGGRDRVFLLRGRATMIERLGSAPVPFDELVSPAGPTDMRGFPLGRFRGASGLIGTLEYRWYISAYLDATLFTDVGTVAGPRFGGLEWDRWFPSFGIGVRYYQPQGAYWQSRAMEGIQIAYAPDGGFRLLLSVAAF